MLGRSSRKLCWNYRSRCLGGLLDLCAMVMTLMRKRHRPRKEENERGRKNEPYGGNRFHKFLTS
jgi:hypothetical protein